MKREDQIYVAGHRGLVGSAIMRELQQRGYRNIITRSHGELDLMDGVGVKTLFDEERPDVVVLAAAKVGGIMANSEKGADFIYENLQIQQNVIGESFRHGVKKLLFLGSTCIYPKLAPQPMKEEYLLSSSLEPTNEPYALAKIAGLKMCEAFNRQYGTNYISVMPTNLYGPNDNFDLIGSHVLPGMLRKIRLAKHMMEGDEESLRKDLRRRPIELSGTGNIREELQRYGIYDDHVTLWGTGLPMREFLWSEDMAEACVYLLEEVEAQDMERLGSSFVNIGTGKEVSIKELSEMIAKEVGYRGGIEFDSTKPDGTPRKLTDPTRLHALGWRHRMELAEGIAKLNEIYLE